MLRSRFVTNEFTVELSKVEKIISNVFTIQGIMIMVLAFKVPEEKLTKNCGYGVPLELS